MKKLILPLFALLLLGAGCEEKDGPITTNTPHKYSNCTQTSSTRVVILKKPGGVDITYWKVYDDSCFGVGAFESFKNSLSMDGSPTPGEVAEAVREDEVEKNAQREKDSRFKSEVESLLK